MGSLAIASDATQCTDCDTELLLPCSPQVQDEVTHYIDVTQGYRRNPKQFKARLCTAM